jgi:hypothetical protein
MSVYVDPIFEMIGPRGNMFWCHMGTDDPTENGIEELMEMADRIGLNRRYFQAKANHPHFDLYPSERALAVKYGAVELPSTEAYSRRCAWPHRVRAIERLIAQSRSLIGMIPPDHPDRSGEEARIAATISTLNDRLDFARRIMAGEDE